jgi:hypothetical protein
VSVGVIIILIYTTILMETRALFDFLLYNSVCTYRRRRKKEMDIERRD